MIRLGAAVLVAVLLSAVSLPAQIGAGTITGIVADQAGAVVRRAAVTVIFVANGRSRVALTDADGRYTAPALPPGLYDVRVELAGFSILMSLGMMVMFYVLNKVIPDWREIARQTGDNIGKPDVAVDARFYRVLLSAFVYPILLPLSMLFGSD